MANRIILQLVLVLSVILLVGGMKMFPDWSCYEGYVFNTDNKNVGQGWIEFAMEKCKDHECPRSCILTYHEIIDDEGTKISTEDEIANWVNLMVFADKGQESARSIAKKIIANCTELSKVPGGPMCSKPFERCVRRSAGCYLTAQEQNGTIFA